MEIGRIATDTGTTHWRVAWSASHTMVGIIASLAVHIRAQETCIIVYFIAGFTSLAFVCCIARYAVGGVAAHTRPTQSCVSRNTWYAIVCWVAGSAVGICALVAMVIIECIPGLAGAALVCGRAG